MQITDVRVRLLSGEDKAKALCTILIDGVFAIHDLRVVEGSSGLFVSMPRRRMANGEYRDVAHPITSETREMIQKTVLQAYQQSQMDKAGD